MVQAGNSWFSDINLSDWALDTQHFGVLFSPFLAICFCLSSCPALLIWFILLHSQGQPWLPGLYLSVPARHPWNTGHRVGGQQPYLPLSSMWCMKPGQLQRNPWRSVVFSSVWCTGKMCVCYFLTLGQLPYGVRAEFRGPPVGVANLCGGNKASVEPLAPESLRKDERMNEGLWFGYICNCLCLVCFSSPWGSHGSTIWLCLLTQVVVGPHGDAHLPPQPLYSPPLTHTHPYSRATHM